MARHSHWAQIKLKKGALDKKRGKIFSKHARFIEVAARAGGGDASMNAALRLAIENARSDNMPRENIERAIKKGTGALTGEAALQEVTYEGYGPGGVALLVETLTDNKNRTNQRIRGIFEEHGGSLGGMGSTSFLFERKGLIRVAAKGDRENDELAIIDSGAEDIEEAGEEYLIYTVANALSGVKQKLAEKGFRVISAELTNIPKNLVAIQDPPTAKKILSLVSALEEEDDVSDVAANFDIPENLIEP